MTGAQTLDFEKFSGGLGVGIGETIGIVDHARRRGGREVEGGSMGCGSGGGPGHFISGFIGGACRGTVGGINAEKVGCQKG